MSQPTHTVQSAGAGAPFGVMLRGGLIPAAIVGIVMVLVWFIARGQDAGLSGLLGGAVTLAFFTSGMWLLAKLITSANPQLFLAIALTVYLGQVIALLVFYILLKDAAWVDGEALGFTAVAVMVVWQVFAIRAFKRARVLVYDEDAS